MDKRDVFAAWWATGAAHTAGDKNGWHGVAAAAWMAALDYVAPKPDAVALGLFVNELLREVAELPDRNSPAEDPDAMTVTGRELTNCVHNVLERHGLSVISGRPE